MAKKNLLTDAMAKAIMDEINYGDKTEPKNIVVHGQLYQRLLMGKAGLLIRGKEPATFENVIIYEINQHNKLGIFISRLYHSVKEKGCIEAIIKCAKDSNLELAWDFNKLLEGSENKEQSDNK